VRRGAPASSKALAGLCRRLATSLEAGIDLRRTLRSEAQRSAGHAGRALTVVSEQVARGESFDAAVAEQAGWLPPLVVEMVRVGERSGATPEVFARLADHYDHRLAIERDLARSFVWPAIQLVAAAAIVAGLIWVGGILEGLDGKPIDFLGFGLVGSAGALTFLGIVLGGVAVAWGAATWVRSRTDLKEQMIEMASRLPIVGPCLQKLGLSRIAWALALTLNVDLDLRRVAPLVLDASGNRRYAKHSAAVARLVGAGQPLSECFAATGEFPAEFLNTLEVGEQTGKLVETTARLSKRYEEEAQHAIGVLSTLAGFLVWGLVSCLVVFLIFRLASFYTGTITDLSKGF
jgi:type IV pilus assembly protein PilC